MIKNSYENGGIKAPDTGALNKALKVKQYKCFFVESTLPGTHGKVNGERESGLCGRSEGGCIESIAAVFTSILQDKINILQKLFTREAAPNSMVQMVYDL